MYNVIELLQKYDQLSYKHREKIYHAICEKVEGDNDGAKINRIEKSLTRFLSKKWDVRSTKGIRSALKTFSKTDKPFTKKDMNKVVKALENAYKSLELSTKGRVKSDLKEIYILNKISFANRFSLSPISKKLLFNKSAYQDGTFIGYNIVEVKSFEWKKIDKVLKKQLKKRVVRLGKVASFSEADALVYENLAKLESVAIGDHFPKTMKASVIKSIEKNVLDKGLNRKDAGEFLEKDLTKKLGGKTAAPRIIQEQGRAATTAYFEGLNATNVTFARNFGQLQMMNEAGITRYIWDSIVDDRTSQVCLQMNGRVFEVDTGIGVMNKVLAVSNVEQLQNVAPFKRDLSEFKLSEGEKLQSRAVASKLAKAGVALPPIHFRCRSEVNPF